MFRNTAYNSNTGRLSMQMGFQEEVDLRVDDRSWITNESDYTIPPQPEWYIPIEFPQGTLPWSELVMRPTELLEEKFLPPAQMLSWGTGTCCNSPSEIPYEENNFFRHFAQKELPTLCYQHPLPTYMTENESLCFTLPTFGEDRYAYRQKTSSF